MDLWLWFRKLRDRNTVMISCDGVLDRAPPLKEKSLLSATSITSMQNSNVSEKPQTTVSFTYFSFQITLNNHRYLITDRL